MQIAGMIFQTRSNAVIKVQPLPQLHLEIVYKQPVSALMLPLHTLCHDRFPVSSFMKCSTHDAVS